MLVIAAVISVINDLNYGTWRSFIKTNLHYWDIFEATTEDDEIAISNWKRKNALALYVIRETCASDKLPLIENIRKAKIAWDTLEEMCNINTGGYLISLLSLENAYA